MIRTSTYVAVCTSMIAAINERPRQLAEVNEDEKQKRKGCRRIPVWRRRREVKREVVTDVEEARRTYRKKDAAAHVRDATPHVRTIEWDLARLGEATTTRKVNRKHRYLDAGDHHLFARQIRKSVD